MAGSQLCASDGTPVQLRGVSTHGLAWYPGYVNQRLFNELRSDWNANVVRLALYPAESGGYCTDGVQDDLYSKVEDGVNFAREADLYAIVDWHVLSEGTPLQYAAQAAEFFQRVSTDFADYDNVIYEICNEPNGSATWDEIVEYANRIVPVIRDNDPDAVIVVGTPQWSQRIDQAQAAPLPYDNVMYALHFYAATHQQDLRDELRRAVEGGLPVFVTEFGISEASGDGAVDYGSANAWVELMDELNVSYVCWSLSNKDESSALISPECTKASGFTVGDLSAEGQWMWTVLHQDVGRNGAQAYDSDTESAQS